MRRSAELSVPATGEYPGDGFIPRTNHLEQCGAQKFRHTIPTTAVNTARRGTVPGIYFLGSVLSHNSAGPAGA